MAIWTRYSQTMSTNNSYIKFRLVATLNSQSVTSNTSSVTVKMQVWRTNSGYTTYGTGTAYVTINGSQYTASIGSSDKFTYNSYTEVFSKTVNVPHSADGSKSLAMVGDIAHSQFSANAQNWSTTLNTIPRTSKPSLNDSTVYMRDQTVTISTNRASSGFTHTITYKFGSASGTIATGVGTSTTWTPPISLASQITSATNGTGTIYCKTYSGSTYIGQESVGIRLYIPANIKPSITTPSVAISGSGADKTIGKYVQSISKAYSSFSGSGTYGSTISAKSLTFRRDSDNANSSSVNAFSGTSSTLTLSGTYEVVAYVRDSRGRTATARRTFTVEAYSPPNITKFSVSRTTAGSTTVSITRNAKWTSMAGANDLTTIRVRKMPLGGAWAAVQSTSSTSTTGSVTSTFNHAGNDLTKSYTFEFYVQDALGKTSTATRTISTAQYPLSIKSNKGIGVGKIWERGVLDVAGDVHIGGDNNTLRLGNGPSDSFVNNVNSGKYLQLKDNGELSYDNVTLVDTAKSTPITPKILGSGVNLNSIHTPGMYYCPSSATAAKISNTAENIAFSLLVEKHAGTKQTFTRYTTSSVRTHVRNYYGGTWGSWYEIVTDTGFSNSPLWTGVSYGSSGTITPSKNITSCMNGWVIIYSDYDSNTSTANNFNFFTGVISKYQVKDFGSGYGAYVAIPASDGTSSSNTINIKYHYINTSYLGSYSGNSSGYLANDVVMRAIYEW